MVGRNDSKALTTNGKALVSNELTSFDHQFVSFRIGEELFGVNILDVREVTPLIDITPVYHAPDEIKGYVNIRGEIHLVLDLRYLLGFSCEEPTEESRIVIFKPKIAESFGILVDKIGDVIEVKSEQIETESRIESSSSSNHNENASRMVSGVCKLEKELLIILNARKFLKQ